MVTTLYTVSFVAGLIPAVMLAVMHARRSWRDNPAGRVLMVLFTVFAASYTMSVTVLLIPDVFRDTAGEWFRIVFRFALAGALWNLVRLYRNALRSGKSNAGSPDS